MRSDRIEVTPPAFDDDLSLSQRVEDFAIEQFIAQARIEALDVAVLPGAAWRDVGGLGTDRCDPRPARPWPRTPAHCRTGCGQARRAG